MSAVLERMERQATLLGGGDRVSLAEIEELAAHERKSWKPRYRELAGKGPVASEGINYVDQLQPFNQADFATVTLLTTSLQLMPTAVWSPTAGGTNYWWVGKTIYYRAFGKITTALTPGNLTLEVRLATTDAGGTLLATSAAQTLIASQTNISWMIEFNVECRAVGSGTNGSLFVWGRATFGTAVIAAGTFLLPASAPAAVAVDTTAASGISLQAKRSGSTAETMTMQDWQRQSN